MTLKDKYLNLSLTKKTVIIAASTFVGTLAVSYLAIVGLTALGGETNSDHSFYSTEERVEFDSMFLESNYPVTVVKDNPDYPVTALATDASTSPVSVPIMVKNLKGESQAVTAIIEHEDEYTHTVKLADFPTTDEYILQQIEAKHGVKVDVSDDSYYFIDRYGTTKEDQQLLKGKDKAGEEGLYLFAIDAETLDFTLEEVETNSVK